MNMQTHHSGQFPGQVPNQGGTMLPGPSQQNHGIPRTAPPDPVIMDPEITRMRKRMQEKICEFLMARRQPSYDVGNKKLMDLVKRLEDGLFKTAKSKEEYINLETLERRLHTLIKRLPLTKHNQQLAHTNSSVGTMIPTPGFQQTGNSSLIATSSLDSSLVAINSSNTIASSTVNSGSFFPTGNGSSGSTHSYEAHSYWFVKQMNMQTHHSGQFPGQVPNQGGTMLPVPLQENGNPVSSQMQNHGIFRTAPLVMMDPEIIRMRKRMQEKICEFLMARRQPSNDVGNKKLMDLVKRLEDGLFKTATSKEEYINLETLERRLHTLITRLPLAKRLPLTNHNQQLAHTNSSVGTMIPTPGFQQTGNSSLIATSSMDSSLSLVAINSSNTIASSTVNSGSFFPTGNGSSGSAHGDYFSSSDSGSIDCVRLPFQDLKLECFSSSDSGSIDCVRLPFQDLKLE